MTTDHKLIIKDFKTGTGFAASCTCGARLQRSTGCNASGYWYARQAAEERFADHLQQVKQGDSQ